MPNGMFDGSRAISAIPVTPFSPDGAVDDAALQGVVAGLVEAGLGLVVACGNTSEYSSLTAAEAERVAAATIEAAEGATTLAGIGGDVATAARQARLAIGRGAAGVMIHFPADPYLSEAGLIRYYRALTDAVDGAVVLYVRGRGLSPAVLEQVLAADNVRAVKYAIPDVVAFGKLVERHGADVTLLCGLAEMWAPFFWLAGAQGFTSGLVNVAPELSLAMLDSLRAGDFPAAMDVWRRVRPFEELRARDANGLNVPVVKEALALRGRLANGAVRPPIAELSGAERDELARILEGWEGAA